MTVFALVASMVLYLIIAIGNFKETDYPHGWMWIFYAFAQGTMIWYQITKKLPE